ncbi:MAG: hypothetical protein ABIH67_03815 [Candidatus Uhrbacteria bacterium]
MLPSPSIVVFDSTWLNDSQANSHRPLLEQILADPRLKIYGFSLFEAEAIKTQSDRFTEQIRPVTPAQDIASLNPALIILDPMLSIGQGMIDLMRGTRLFIWIKQQPAFAKLPIIFITDINVDPEDKRNFQTCGLVDVFNWQQLRHDSIGFKSVVTNIFVAHQHKTTP